MGWTPGEGLHGLRERFGLPPFAAPGQRLQGLALSPGIPGFDGNRHQRLAPGQRRVLIPLAAQQAVAQHQHRVAAVQLGAGGQVFGELRRRGSGS